MTSPRYRNVDGEQRSNEDSISQQSEMSEGEVIGGEEKRNLLAFWLLGLCNNFSYVVMLSAAVDILAKQQHKDVDIANALREPPVDPFHNLEQFDPFAKSNTTGFHCTAHSTGLILLADILPAILLKLTAPLFMQSISYHMRVAFTVITAVISYLLVALSGGVAWSVVGVVFASISSGFGELTFLSLSSHFHVSVITFWGSGTGAAGVFGSLTYAALTSAGMSPRNSTLLMLVVPALLAATFWLLLVLPLHLKLQLFKNDPDEQALRSPILDSPPERRQIEDQTLGMPLSFKLMLVKPLLQYMIPLFLVYLAEYTINQGLFELLYYNIDWLTQAEQYRWFQVDYQVGVLISRSSTYFFRIRKIILPAMLQFVIFTIVLMEVMHMYMEHIWVALAVIFIEGLCGGAVYVNAFYNISRDVPKEFREYSMGVASCADSLGITVAGFIAIPIHTALCNYKLAHHQAV